MDAVASVTREGVAGIVLLVALACLSSCGGGGEGEASVSESLTRAQFVKRASAICRSEEARKARALRAASERGKSYLAGSRRELEKLVSEAILPLYAEMIEEMAELSPPPKDAAQVERIISQYEQTLEKAKANPGRQLVDDSFVTVNQLAARYGIEECTL
jgi:hypothetical protein